MPISYDVHWSDLHGDELSEFCTLKASDHADAAEMIVGDEESLECSYSVGDGHDTATVLVRAHESEEEWRRFVVRGKPEVTYTAAEETD